MKKIGRIFISVAIMLVMMVMIGCSDEKVLTKEERIANIQAAAENAKNCGLTCSSMFVDYEVENAIEELNNTDDLREQKKIEETAVAQINNLVLSADDELMIKNIYISNIRKWWNGETYTLDEVNVLYYFGQHDGIHLAMIENFKPTASEFANYMIDGYHFSYLREWLAVFEDNGLYYFDRTYKGALLGSTYIETMSIYSEMVYEYTKASR